jgi:hypothetical protein
MQFLVEQIERFDSAGQEDQINDFYHFCCVGLEIFDNPTIFFITETGGTSFGSYSPSQQLVMVATNGRHISDILRTFAHELVHHKQMEVNPNAPIEELEYEANAIAGMIMRDYNKLHPEMFNLTTEIEDAAPSDSLGDSQGAVADDTTRPSQPVEMSEDAGAVTAGSGDIAGIGVGPQGEPGFTKKNRPNMFKRKTLKQLKEELKG